MKIHIVQKGDTLWKLANKYKVNFEQLKAANTQLSNPDMIMPGMKIKIPSGSVPVKKEAAKAQVKEMPIPSPAPMPQPMMMPQAKPSHPKPMTPEQHLYETKMDFNFYQPQPLPSIPKPPKEAPKKEMPLAKEMPKPIAPKPPAPIPQPVAPIHMMPMPDYCLQPITPLMPGCASCGSPFTIPYGMYHQPLPHYLMMPTSYPMQAEPYGQQEMGMTDPNIGMPSGYDGQSMMMPSQQMGYAAPSYMPEHGQMPQYQMPGGYSAQPMMHGQSGYMMPSRDYDDYEQPNQYNEEDEYED
uniref:SafA/ExsA family spore coat assembly protein n=1 Tax=Halalkalibacterium ligniniphilum TaxID=1134413 RepID=UPI00034DC7FE|nr:SafA/ExsA family spore coat assembly protein [Halalkalibacterium ligniniphilum]